MSENQEPISAIKASELGEAHWATDQNQCKIMARKIGKKLSQTLPAIGGGYWCIFRKDDD